MSKIRRFGEEVDGYSIPVLNEREIRAAAGILFLMMFISILQVIHTNSFLMLKFAVIIFLADISIRIFINPKYAPTLIIGRLFIRNQTPEYVGAQQKKFAWIIGLVLAITMFILLVLVNSYSPITGLICFVCLIFLFFESAFGICLGCKFYSMVYKEKAQYCPGEVCDVKSRHDIQKTSLGQMLIVIGFLAFIVLMVYFFKDNFNVAPQNLFAIENSVHS
ncbi:MAG: DUF4395 domain-containing protein [Bacteroidales bacterium]|nr:DUF4395 domain-containing protein [Bacteroidales bacterium]MCF8390422.1 DUF4395 domain-containing protein [Bacteroidales bacterium]